MVQPVLGVTADFFGKTRLMNLCVLVMALATLVCAVASDFWLLVAMRIAAGLVAGGVFPGRDGADRRPRADAPAAGRDRAAAWRCAHRQRARRILRRHHRRPHGLARGVRRARPVLARGGADGLLRIPQHHLAETAAVQTRSRHRKLPRHPRRPACQGLLRRGVPGGDLHPRAVSLYRAAAAKHRRVSRVDRGAADRVLCDRRHRIFAAWCPISPAGLPTAS